MSAGAAGTFTSSLACLAEPALTRLSGQLDHVAGLAAADRAAIRAGTASAVYQSALRKVTRVLLLELNAARITGKLTADDAESRWAQFIEMSATPRYWESLTAYYPAYLAQLREIIARRCAAALTMAQRLGHDRDILAPLTGCPLGALAEVTIGAGDSHRGGQTVAVLRFATGSVVYKPRSVRVDAVLGEVLAAVLHDVPGTVRIRVPRVLDRGDYGWAEHVSHRFCAGPAELATFYRGIGHWLAVMRLVGGSDLHAENVIACGPVPVVVDCETLFTPAWPSRPSGFGLAVDQASDLVNATVLRTGMLPSRGIALGWRGVDVSAAGALPGEQPVIELPVVVDAGTDRARMGRHAAELAIGASHPSPEPVLVDYWDQVPDGFAEITAKLRAMERGGELEPLLARFADCPIRVVLRSTEAYAELARMLWHPVSLHDPDAARERATGLLAGMAEYVPGAPDDSEVIDAEVTELLHGDIPFFATTPRLGRLTGPVGTTWAPEQDLIADALARWRSADFGLDTQVIQATVVSAYLNDGWMPGERRMRSAVPRHHDLEQRRRALAAAIVRQVRDTAFRADDGTVTWIAPVLHPTGWAVQPLGTDSYGGLPGVSVLLAAYQRECAAGRADKVGGIDDLLTATLRTTTVAEDRLDSIRRSSDLLRPTPPGGYIGLGSQIWAWLTLHDWGAAGSDGLARARALARLLPASVAADDRYDVLSGMAGAIVPLLQLATVTRERAWAEQAAEIGERLAAAAYWHAGTACWRTRQWPAGLGGFSHGATGIGWALARLALATGDTRFADVARAAFAFEATLFDQTADGWRDLRESDAEAFPVAWCNGGVGIGISAADLAALGWLGEEAGGDLVSRAAAIADRNGFGWNHTLCHGDLGCWELLGAALATGRGPAGLTQADLDARVIGSLEDHGPVTGLARDAFSPGLMAGQGGIAYQLLRLNAHARLPSVLTLCGCAVAGQGMA